MSRILIFGGTAEARELAGLLVRRGYDVTTSLAGVTNEPRLPEHGAVVRGGFGGAAGIAAYIAREHIAAIVDATHPFAARISQHAYSASIDCGIPYFRIERPPWIAEPGDQWTEVSNIAAAVAAVPDGAKVMLTVGRKEAAAFLARPGLTGIVRMIEEPVCAIPDVWTLIRERPPFSVEHEAALIEKHGLNVLATKNSGGGQTYSKLLAARAKCLPVVMIARPLKPQAPSFTTAAGLAAAMDNLLNS